MKAVKDLKVGDTLYFYYGGMDSIDERIVSNIQYTEKGFVRISIEGIGELYGNCVPLDTELGYYYLEFSQAKKDLINNLKRSLKTVREAKRITVKSLDAEISEIKRSLKKWT